MILHSNFGVLQILNNLWQELKLCLQLQAYKQQTDHSKLQIIICVVHYPNSLWFCILWEILRGIHFLRLWWKQHKHQINEENGLLSEKLVFLLSFILLNNSHLNFCIALWVNSFILTPFRVKDPFLSAHLIEPVQCCSTSLNNLLKTN